MRTFDKDTYTAARAAWDAGDFGPEWREARSISWERGFPYPPEGSRWDDPENGDQTQRSIIFRALDYRPVATIAIIRTSRSWSEVIARIIRDEQTIKEHVDSREWEAENDKKSQPTHREAATVLGDVMQRIADSKGIE